MRIIIRAVPARAEFILYLRRHLPQAEWCYDRKRDAWDTFVRALELAGADAAVHMEEDVLLTDGFLAKLKAAIAEHPKNLIQFFSMRKADLEVGSRWDRNYIMNQCFYLPAGYSAEILKYSAIWPGRAADPTGIDIMINDWLRSRGEAYWVHVPSLVEHRIAPSMINPRRSSRRQSKTFANPLA